MWQIRTTDGMWAEVSGGSRSVESSGEFEDMLFEALAQRAEHELPPMVRRGIAPREEILKVFHRAWGVLEEEMELALDSEEALRRMAELVTYDIPDGTRSTLTVKEDVEIGQDAGLFCLAFIHTLQSLGALRAVMVTHTSYNRLRGADSTHRVLKILAEGVKPMALFARAKGVNIHLLGMGQQYELRKHLDEAFPPHQPGNFDVYFLVDYNEDYFLGEGQEHLLEIPDIDVCIRHTKMSMGGGWIPQKMLKSSFVYCQNGSLFSNWRFEELTVLASLSLAAKLLHSGEGLTKTYGDVDEVKWRHQMRELKLFHKTIELSPKAKKLCLVGSPIGVYRVMF